MVKTLIAIAMISTMAVAGCTEVMYVDAYTGEIKTTLICTKD